MKRKTGGGIEAIKRRYGWYFVAPWAFGVILFVLVPLFSSFYYSLADIAMRPEGLQADFVGLQHYKKLFLEDPDYINQVTQSLSSLFTSVPIVIALSMILAIVLNQKFRGRMFARAVFFLPVIIASGAVMKVLTGFSMSDTVSASAGISGGEAMSEYMQIINFSDMLHHLNLPQNVNSLIGGYLSNTFNLIWNCGVQVLLFVAGLQTIPEQLYEAGKVEGISPWEEFWYITVPMLGRVIMLVLFYTMVELFIEKGTVVSTAIRNISVNLAFSRGSAMLWPYFAAVSLIIGS
ncbi:MAG: sugar ABC transporter permease, partial [Oscillospiraceae bacterium]|nr:sugar ABC transporter permease [Oscillospiraceae bacterium]